MQDAKIEARIRRKFRLVAVELDERRRRQWAAVEARETELLHARDGILRRLPNLMDDTVPYGIDANRPAIETLMRYAAEQGLIPRAYQVAELFVR